jgi:hypothetical protein
LAALGAADSVAVSAPGFEVPLVLLLQQLPAAWWSVGIITHVVTDLVVGTRVMTYRVSGSEAPHVVAAAARTRCFV